MRRRNLIRTVVAVVVVAAATVVHLAPPAEAQDETTAVIYLPPVDAPVIDPFRAPTTPYGPGNRGIDYGTEPGQPVTSAAPGEVVFAGHVANDLHVVVLHQDGIRTSYSFLATIAVQRGDHVDHTTTLGTTGATRPLHFGARAPLLDDDRHGATYLDPLVLLGQRPSTDDEQPHARLVADPHPDRPLSESEERGLLADALQHVGRAATWLKDQVELTVEQKLQLAEILLDDFVDLNVPVPVHLVVAALRWRDEQATCTPPTTPLPPPPSERRIVILVGGLGSSTGHAAVLDTDTAALGYDDRDVRQFDGYAPARDAEYDAHDTQTDLDAAARRLAADIRATQRRNPGIPVDVIAHSQGGLVARAAVALHGARPAFVATLGTPHHGTDAATAATALDLTDSGSDALDVATKALTDPVASLDLDSRSILQMSETSPFIGRLNDEPLPPPATTRFLSIAVRGDVVVPNHQSRVEGADNTVITTTGRLNEHDGLPRAEPTTTELRRGLAEQAPTCRSLADTLADEAQGRQISHDTDQLAVWATATALYVDFRGRG